MVALELLERAQSAGVRQQHRKGMLGDGRRVGTPHIGHDNVGVGQRGHAPHPLHAGTGRLHPAQLPGIGKIVRSQLSVNGVHVGHQRRRRVALVGHDDVYAVLLLELSEA